MKKDLESMISFLILNHLVLIVTSHIYKILNQECKDLNKGSYGIFEQKRPIL